ncbi:MAG: hypothetical protein KJ063_14025 [Anaerolineae bacterium]|nr:hypothetical protein [Anaerolineae bacterium]
MNRHDVKLLQSFNQYPCVSILLPTHRTAPDNRQDPIRVKNLVIEAGNQLLAQFSKREAEPILKRLAKIAEEIDYRYTLDGLAIFVNQEFAVKYYLPFTLNERVILDHTFATRDLVFALNRTPRYWVLALSEQPTRLFEGTRETLVEIEGDGFPMTHTGPGGEGVLPGGEGVNKSAYRDERHRQFFRQVDGALRPLFLDDPLPIIVAGVDRHLSFFEEVSQHKQHILAMLKGSYDKAKPHELGTQVWPLAKQGLAAKRQEIFKELEAAIGARKFVSTLGEAWRLAQEGRGASLLVEEDYHVPGRVDESGFHLTLAEGESGPDVMADAVDELIELVLSKGGQVTFVDNGSLQAHQRVALILRY